MPRALRGLGRHFEVLTPGIVYKQYPTCSLMHALIDMVLQARAQGLLTPVDGLELRCAISQRLEAVRGKEWPATGLAAKFCVEYCVAVAVQEGSQGIADFTDAAIHRPGLRELAQRVRLSQGQDFPPGNGDCAELVVLRDEREVLRRRQAKPCGHPSMPLSSAQHEAKFMACAAPVLGAEKARLRPPLREITFVGMMIGSGRELLHFFNWTRSAVSAAYVARLLAIYARDVAVHGRAMRLTNGNALAARLRADSLLLQPFHRRDPADDGLLHEAALR